MSNMTLLINCICTRCGNTSTYFKEVGVDAVIPVCVFCEIEMRNVYDVARECVREKIDVRKRDAKRKLEYMGDVNLPVFGGSND